MHLTEQEIEALGEQFKQRLRDAAPELPQEAPSLSKMQDWMIRNQIENADVLKLAVKKVGKGNKAGKKTARDAGLPRNSRATGSGKSTREERDS